jgi:hypothetical protein
MDGTKYINNREPEYFVITVPIICADVFRIAVQFSAGTENFFFPAAFSSALGSPAHSFVSSGFLGLFIEGTAIGA